MVRLTGRGRGGLKSRLIITYDLIDYLVYITVNISNYFMSDMTYCHVNQPIIGYSIRKHARDCIYIYSKS